MTDQATKPSPFNLICDLAHRGQAILELMEKPDCNDLVKSILEREKARNDEKLAEALQAVIDAQLSTLWFPPAGYNSSRSDRPHVIDLYRLSTRNLYRLTPANLMVTGFELAAREAAKAAGAGEFREHPAGVIVADLTVATKTQLADARAAINNEFLRRRDASKMGA